MVQCDNPISCQMAKRELCKCKCHGANHGILRRMMENSETKEEAEMALEELRVQQASLKKQASKERRQKRLAEKKLQRQLTQLQLQVELQEES